MHLRSLAPATLIALATLADGCGPGAATAGPDAGAPDPHAELRICRERPFSPAPAEPWRHTIATPIITATGAAHHSAADAIEPDPAAVALRGKFTYGPTSKDLEDERVGVWIDDCTGWRALGDATTDDDGRIAVALPTGLLAAPGIYEARFEVLGDQSTTTATVYLLPAGTHLAITDLDGTLTTSDTELFHELLDGSYVPAAYPAAAELTAAHAATGQVVVYLTGRPYFLSEMTRGWLAAGGYARGPLRLTDALADSMPTEGSVGDFKRGVVADLVAKGYAIDVAYGNATTDLYAYEGGGVPADRIWIIGPHAGEAGSHPVTGSWASRAAEVRAEPPVDQPYTW